MKLGKRLAIIDIDVTIADLSHREHFINRPRRQQDWKSFLHPWNVGRDRLQPGACEAIKKLMASDYKVIFLTGRNSGLMEVTKTWIRNSIGVDTYTYGEKEGRRALLIMRPEGNNEPATLFKGRQINKILKTLRPTIVFAFDDDPYMWPEYERRGFIVFRAPDCWQSMFPVPPKLPPETCWRK